MSDISIQIDQNASSNRSSSHRPSLSERQPASSRKYQPLVYQHKKKDGTTHTFNIGCGCSGEDLIIIASCYITFWSFLLGFFTLLLKGALDTDDSHTMLWSFLYFGIFFSALVTGSVYVGSKEKGKDDCAQNEK
mmetsp:Transcript_26507/g.39022  ORF Transcript_26507/g.39022 Transcript_26507/m.39022 type:complete len:134 (+) Transcript_26507:94-495(+)